MRVDEINGKMVPTAMMGRNRLHLMANGKDVNIDGNVEQKSIIR